MPGRVRLLLPAPGHSPPLLPQRGPDQEEPRPQASLQGDTNQSVNHQFMRAGACGAVRLLSSPSPPQIWEREKEENKERDGHDNSSGP